MHSLTVFRHTLTPDLSLGTLYVDGKFFCYTLEDADRLGLGFAKIHGKTAIPTGIYRVGLTQSQRFGREMPVVKGVPGFTGIRIHPGNTEADTSGCILVGNILTENGIHGSRSSFNELFVMLKDEPRTEQMFLYVERIALTRNMEDHLRTAWRKDAKGVVA